MRARRWSTGLLVASTLSLLPTGSFTLDGGASRVTFFVNDNRGGFAGLAPDVSAQAEVREQDGTFSADVTVRMTDFTIPIPRFLIFVAEDPVQVTLKLRFRASD